MAIHNQDTSRQEAAVAPAATRRQEMIERATGPSPRHVVLAVAVSLDGYIARRDGRVDWLIRDPTLDLGAYANAFDVIVAGRKTLDLEPASEGRRGPFGKMACYIFSRTRPPGKRGAAEYVNKSPSELVRDLKALPGKDIWLMGGGRVGTRISERRSRGRTGPGHHAGAAW